MSLPKKVVYASDVYQQQVNIIETVKFHITALKDGSYELNAKARVVQYDTILWKKCSHFRKRPNKTNIKLSIAFGRIFWHGFSQHYINAQDVKAQAMTYLDHLISENPDDLKLLALRDSNRSIDSADVMNNASSGRNNDAPYKVLSIE